MAQFFRHVGARGELELLPEGTVERELAEKGERLYQLSDLDELLAELRASKMDTPSGDPRPGLAESPANPEAPAVPGVDIQEVGELLISRALAGS